MSSSKIDVLNELLEETFRCAEESNTTSDFHSFSAFVEDMLPPDVLDTLYSEANASLEDIWNERYAPEPEDVTTDEAEEEIEDPAEYVEEGCCVLCYREMKLTRHHTIPREMHAQVSKKLGTPKDILNQTIPVCRMCHSTIHRFFTNKELAFSYNTLDLLAEDERIQKFAKWASGLAPRGTMSVRR